MTAEPAPDENTRARSASTSQVTRDWLRITWRFALLIGVFSTFVYLDEVAFDNAVMKVITESSASGIGIVLRAFGADATSSGDGVTYRGVGFLVTPACTGYEVLELFAAAVIAAPLPWAFRLRGLAMGLPAEVAEQLPGYDRTQYDLAPIGGLDRASQLLRIGLLQHVSPGAGAHAGEDRLRIVEHRDQDDADVGVLLEYLPGGLSAVDHRHLDVHQYDVRDELPRQSDDLRPARRLADHDYLAHLLQYGTKPLPEEGVVVSQQDLYGFQPPPPPK